MKLSKAIFVISVTLSLTLGTALPVFAQPGLPSSFYGSVQLTDGGNVPEGTIISAWIDGVQYASTAVSLFEGITVYNLNVPGDDPLTGPVEGGNLSDTVYFKIDAANAVQTASWQGGTNVNLDLTIAPNVYTLTVNKSGNGTGTVASNPVAIDCGSTCSFEFTEDTLVSLMAEPAIGSTFTGWDGDVISSDNPIVFTVIDDITVTAIFTSDTYEISGNAGIADAVLTYTGGTTIADDEGNFSFSVLAGWSGSLTPSKSYYSFEPASLVYEDVFSDQVDQNFTAILEPPTFEDVPYNYNVTLGGVTYYLHDYIEALYDAGYTAGCWSSPLRYCPANTMTRAESAVFMMRGNFGNAYTPPTVLEHIFADNWSLGPWAEKWAEGMYDASLTAGCWANPLRFCPWDLVPREQAAVFALKMKYGETYLPPPASGDIFADMSDPSYWGTKWAEKAYLDGLIVSCGTQDEKQMFCPTTLLTRAWAAYMIVTAKDLPMVP